MKYGRLPTSSTDIVQNNEGILVCKGRISGEYPVFLPNTHKFSEIVIKNAHLKTTHGLVSLTMGEVRKTYWIERLRSGIKSIIEKCALCKRYHSKSYADPPTTALPDYRTTPSRAFENIGIDFAGPFEYKCDDNLVGKAYICLYTCAASRANHLVISPKRSAARFRGSLKDDEIQR